MDGSRWGRHGCDAAAPSSPPRRRYRTSRCRAGGRCVRTPAPRYLPVAARHGPAGRRGDLRGLPLAPVHPRRIAPPVGDPRVRRLVRRARPHRARSPGTCAAGGGPRLRRRAAVLALVALPRPCSVCIRRSARGRSCVGRGAVGAGLRSGGRPPLAPRRRRLPAPGGALLRARPVGQGRGADAPRAIGGQRRAEYLSSVVLTDDCGGASRGRPGAPRGEDVPMQQLEPFDGVIGTHPGRVDSPGGRRRPTRARAPPTSS